MRVFLRSKKLMVTACIVLSVAFFTRCINNAREEVVVINNAGEQFAGSESCNSCHHDITRSFQATAHYHTSGQASENSVMGSFAKGENLFAYSYYSKVAMEKRDSGLYQVEYDKNFNQQQAHRIEIIVGSGARGQSYLTWVNNKLNQLPVSYFTSANAWANSPGYPYYQPLFKRNITATCLECHSTYFKTLPTGSVQSPEFDKNQIVYGVQCESCHGPAKKHVVYQEQHPKEKRAKFIVNPSSLSRQQQLDLCGFCHGGIKQSQKPAFSFSPGDTLANFFANTTTEIKTSEVEVHDNQYALLASSKCFKMSPLMTCNTCHNTHKQERGQSATFSARCMSCHSNDKANFCKMAPRLGNQITQNCIDCHMPQKSSKILTVQLEGKSLRAPSTLRSHVIAIYPKETRKFLSEMKR